MSGGQASVVFDFDGTLVDSARGILAGISEALDAQGITPRVLLSPAIIGPPLLQTLQLVSGLDNDASLASLATEFRRRYDLGGYRNTDPYPGVEKALRELRKANISLLIVTNKRGIPTRLVLDHLGWTPLFQAVYCLDEYPDCADKSAVLARLLRDMGLVAEASPYVGDTAADARAASANGMPFLHAAWGYGGSDAELRDALTCATPSQIPETLLQTFPLNRPCPAN